MTDLGNIFVLAIPLGMTLSLIIGPVFFVLIETSVSKGFRAALALDLGVLLSDIFFIIIAFYGSTDWLGNIHSHSWLELIGGIFFITYGLSEVIQKGRIKRSRFIVKKVNYIQLMAKGFLLNFLNFGVFIFWIGVVIIIHPKLGANTTNTVIYFIVLFCTFLLMDCLKILLAKRVKSKLNKRRLIICKQVIGLILVFFGIGVFIHSFF